MHSELTNLLPLERQRTLVKDYILRLSVVGVLFITALTLMAAVLLLPTYVFLTESADAKAKRLAAVTSALATSDEKELSARLAALAGEAAVLTAFKNTSPVSEHMRAILSVARPGIALSGFTLVPTEGEQPQTLSLTGVAATRGALRAYQIALEDAPSIVSAALPVSAYAKDSDITFTVTVTFSP